MDRRESITEPGQPATRELQSLRITINADDPSVWATLQYSLGMPTHAQGCVDHDIAGCLQNRSQ